MGRRSYLVVSLIISIVVGGYVLYRHHDMENLRKIALSSSSDTRSAESSVEQLSRYRGSTAVDLLLQVAAADREFIDSRQELAIKEVGRRGDASAMHRLARILQPFNGLARREAVAAALEENACDEECALFILHYLERQWCGMEKWEDIPSLGPSSVYSELEKELSDLSERLHAILLKNSDSTLHDLRTIYGLGSPQPSAFALYIVGKLRLRRACPLLVTSKRNLLDPAKKEKIESLLGDLECLSQRDSTN